jgi:hypothetical protein
VTKLIEFAEGLSLPHDAATQTIACIARKRAGKSYAAGKLAEGFHAVGVQFVVIDPVGNWYGLRVAANGKDAGLDVIILGGLRGDIPLDPSAGALIADAVLDSGRSFVLDVSQFSLGERKRFVTAFGERLWLRQKGLADPQPIHVFLEEAQLFLPQQPMPDDRHMLGIWTEIVRLGGNKGIGVTLITQRPQSVTKEALTQVECLVVLQVNGVPEKKALKEWIVEKGADTKLLEELPFLKQGTAYIWSPQWLEHFGKHAIRQKWTYDAGATPKVGVKKVQAELKPIDLEALRAQMAQTVAKLEESDPKVLKRRIVALETQLKKLIEVSSKVQAPKAGKVETKTVEVPVLQEKELKLLDKHLALGAELVASMYKLTDRFNQSAQVIATESNNLALTMKQRFAAAKPPPLPRAAPLVVQVSTTAKKPIAKVPAKSHGNGVYSFPADVGEQKLGRGAREMLKALACRNPTALSRGQVATLAGISPRSSTFRNYMSMLRVQRYIHEDHAGMHITDEGLAFLGDDVPSQPTTTEELVSLWSSKFTGKVNEMLRVLVDQYPNGMSKDQLGETVGISPASSTFRNYLSMLRSNELLGKTAEGDLKASDTLFPN